MNVSGNWIYYDDGNDNGKLFKIKIDGTDKSTVTYSSCNSLNVVGDIIYFAKYENKGWRLFKVNTDGSKETKLSNDMTNIDKMGTFK